MTPTLLIAMIPLYAQVAQPPAVKTDKPSVQAAKPILLTHVFKKGEKLEYEVKAGIHLESRELGLDTWIPQEEDFVYKFSTEVIEMKADGVAVLRYLRPTFTEIAGQTADSPSKPKVNKNNEEILFTVSSVNQVLSIKDKTKKKPDNGNDSGGGDQGGGDQGGGSPGGGLLFIGPGFPGQTQGMDLLHAWMAHVEGEINQLVLLINAIDLAPDLPWVAVTPGYTWKVTGGRSPQLVPESGGKMAEQRIDFTYTYVGPMTVNGKTFLRIHADCALDSDLWKYLQQIYRVSPEQTNIKAIPFKMKSQVDFDLDPVTRRTLRATTSGSGEEHVMVTGIDNPVDEVKMDGSTKLTLLSAKP